MSMELCYVILLPFLGTSLGAACVFFMKTALDGMLQKILNGFAAGVMTAASIWGLLIPAMEQAQSMGKWSFVPPVTGFWLGILFLMLLDRLIPRLYNKLVAAVTLHNIPEGMAVGVAYAGYLAGNTVIPAMGILVLALGIAIQNFPEGAIISMPLRAKGQSRMRAFLAGVLSGVVEPAGAAIAILISGLITPALAYFLGFAAGAMICVVIEELMPEISTESHSNVGTIFFAAGFSIMMILDVTLG